MKKVFIIFENGSGWEDEPEVVGFSETKEEADKVCYTMSFYYQQLLAFRDELAKVTKPIYDEDVEYEKGLDWPRWPAGTPESKITKEMRNERDEIQAKNIEIGDRNSERVKIHNDKIKKVVAEKVKELDKSEMSNYIRKGLSDTGSVRHHLYPYTNEEINKL